VLLDRVAPGDHVRTIAREIGVEGLRSAMAVSKAALGALTGSTTDLV